MSSGGSTLAVRPSIRDCCCRACALLPDVPTKACLADVAYRLQARCTEGDHGIHEGSSRSRNASGSTLRPQGVLRHRNGGDDSLTYAGVPVFCDGVVLGSLCFMCDGGVPPENVEEIMKKEAAQLSNDIGTITMLRTEGS